LSIFSGFAETQFPIEGEANVAFMDCVGSTQAVNSRSSRRCLLLRCATRSSVRTKCHKPFRKLGPWNSSALAVLEIELTISNATTTQKPRMAIDAADERLAIFILVSPNCRSGRSSASESPPTGNPRWPANLAQSKVACPKSGLSSLPDPMPGTHANTSPHFQGALADNSDAGTRTRRDCFVSCHPRCLIGQGEALRVMARHKSRRDY